VTITKPDGQEINQMVWLGHDQKEKAEVVVREITEIIGAYGDIRFQQVIAAMIAEQFLGVESKEKPVNLPTRPKGQKNDQKGNQIYSRAVRRER
jgi:hypothetical protein